MPQNPTLPPAIPGRRSGFIWAHAASKIYGKRKGDQDWEAVRQAMEQASIAGNWQTDAVGELSGGERQRVLFALALAQEPQSFTFGRADNFSGH